VNPELPVRVGPYRVVRLLGQGGAGRVYEVERGHPLDLARPVERLALKLLKEPQAELRPRLAREIALGLSLDHPRVCRMLDWGEEGADLYLVMELLEGRTLAHFLAGRGPLPAAEVRPLLEQVLEGLEALHDAGLVHRDLKPGNLFLTRNQGLKIMDFGLARGPGVATLTPAGAGLGTLGFVSPEQLDDARRVDRRSDLFNVGILAFLMLTGRLPFDPGSPARFVAQLARGRRPRLGELTSGVPEGADTWLDRLLAPDPEARFPDARSARQALPF
jgi:serine/threonine-protein kinase